MWNLYPDPKQFTLLWLLWTVLQPYMAEKPGTVEIVHVDSIRESEKNGHYGVSKKQYGAGLNLIPYCFSFSNASLNASWIPLSETASQINCSASPFSSSHVVCGGI